MQTCINARRHVISYLEDVIVHKLLDCREGKKKEKARNMNELFKKKIIWLVKEIATPIYISKVC